MPANLHLGGSRTIKKKKIKAPPFSLFLRNFFNCPTSRATEAGATQLLLLEKHPLGLTQLEFHDYVGMSDNRVKQGLRPGLAISPLNWNSLAT